MKIHIEIEISDIDYPHYSTFEIKELYRTLKSILPSKSDLSIRYNGKIRYWYYA